MRIILPNKKIELDLKLTYDERVILVNSIISEYESYFNDYWEDKKRKQGGYAQRVKIALDTMASYLFYGNAISERKEEYQILNDRQLETRNIREISVDLQKYDESEGSDVNTVLSKFKNNNIKQQGKIKLKKYINSKTHRFTTIRVLPSLRVNRSIYLENSIYRHDWKIEFGKINYICSKGKDISINCFEESDMELPYIDGGKEYKFSWCPVDTENRFTFLDNKYEIMKPYEYDMILYLEQEDNVYFLDVNVNLVTNIKNINKGD